MTAATLAFGLFMCAIIWIQYKLFGDGKGPRDN